MATKVTEQLVEQLPWLDEVADVLKKVWGPVAGKSAPQPLKDLLVGTWLGHPLHPVAVQVPIGFWTSALVFDLIGKKESADFMILLGVASATPVMATGAAQWIDTTSLEKPRRLGAFHATVNTIATGLYAASLIARLSGNRRGGIALSTAGFAFINLGGLFGGDLAYDLGIGINHAAFGQPPTEWTEVLDESELEPNKPKRVEVGGVPVMLLKHEDGIHAIGAVCAHLGGPLDKGKIDGETVTCPWHGSVYSLQNGKLLHSPASFPVDSYEVRVQNGRLSIRVAELRRS